MNLLLIDDEAFALKLLARQLANLGFEEVIPCEHARDALAARVLRPANATDGRRGSRAPPGAHRLR